MTKLELIMNMVESMEGLDVSLKVGKESELIVKGDFKKMINAFATVIDADERDNHARREIEKFEESILR